VDDLIQWAEFGVKAPGDNLFGDLTDIGKAFTNPTRPGDPGHAPDPAGPAAPVPQPSTGVRPPATGDSGLAAPPAASLEREELAAVLLLVLATTLLMTRRANGWR
jgi:hypothetical protein